MDNEQSKTLLKKIESAHFDASEYPRLEELAALLGAEFAAAVNEQIDAAIENSGVSFTAMNGQRSLEGKEESYVLFVSRAANRFGSVLVSVSTGLAGAVAEAMFGGEFSLSEIGGGSSDVDVAILGMTLNKVLTCLGGAGKSAAQDKNAPPARVQAISFSSKELEKFEKISLCNIALDLSQADDTCSEAIIFHFPMEYLEAQNLLTKGRKHDVEDEDASRWRDEMNANVNDSEIQLDIILDTFSLQLSKLANLQVGEVITLPKSADNETSIILNTADGACVIGSGRLGAYKDQKAIKLSSDLKP